MLLLRGFTLLELLVVITIVGIISTIAIPAYGVYVVKANVSNLIIAGDAYKSKFIDHMLTATSVKNSIYQPDNALIDKIIVQTIDTEPVKYVIEVVANMKTSSNSGIGIRQPRGASGPLVVQLQGTTGGDAIITWTCHAPSEYNDYLPATCNNNDLEVLPSF